MEEEMQGPKKLAEAGGVREDVLTIPRQIDPVELRQEYLC